MCDRIKAVDETCSQTFPRKLEQNFSIFVAKIQRLYGWKKLHRSHFVELPFCPIKVIEATAFE